MNTAPAQRLTFSLKGLLALALIASLGTATQARDYPSKRISIIVPYSAGGTTDILARQVAKNLSDAVDQAVTVDNRPGAGATLGAMLAARSRPDGYTLFMGQVSSHGIAPAVYKNLQYDPLKDFQPVTLLISIPNVMVVRKDHPAQTVEEFLALAKGERIRFGSSGVGSSVHLSGEMFKTRTGLDMVHVPFRGSSEAIPALMAGDIDVMFDNLPASLPHIQAGALRALAVTTLHRSKSLPAVRTLAECGLDELEGFSAESWFGLLVQKNVDPAIVAQLSTQLNAILATPDFKTFADRQGGVVKPNTPESFTRFIESELSKWSAVAGRAGVAAD